MRNFFVHQERARQGTRRLVLLFSIMMILVVTTIYSLCAAIYVNLETANRTDKQRARTGVNVAPAKPVSYWQPELLALSAAATGLVIGGGSAYRISQLAVGGSAVAQMMQGRLLSSATREPPERRLLNIVEEMSIASGVPMPQVYLLDEDCINAFAAGYAPGDAVIGISRGCLTYLTRDELQGVIAHEFSHILNGDMKLNIRLIGWVHGLVFLSVVGYYLLNIAARSRSGNSSNSNSDKNGNQLVVIALLLGAGAWLAGLIGSLMGQIIQAAISRQREFLADASAVQFTRYPDGIGGALKKIGGLDVGSTMKNPQAREINHMCFGESVARFSGWLASHPPTGERIRRIEPNWDGTYPPVRPLGPVALEPPTSANPGKTAPSMIPGVPSLPGGIPLPAAVGVMAMSERTVERVGNATDRTAKRAAEIAGQFPPGLLEAARNSFSARTLIYSLLLDSDGTIRTAQLAALEAATTPQDIEELRRHLDAVAALPRGLRLPLVDISIPALREMSKGQYDTFRAVLQRLIDADGRMSTFEYALSSLVGHHLDSAYRPETRSNGNLTNLRASITDLRRLLSVLAWAGTDSPAEAARSFEAGMATVRGTESGLPILVRADATLEAFDAAMIRLSRGNLAFRKQVVQAVAATILFDQVVTVEEDELIRVVCANLDCPVPPLPSA